VDAATPADAQLIKLKETEHSFDTLVPGPVKYVHAPAVYGYGLHGGIIAAPAVSAAEPVELPKIELPTTYAAHGLLGYPGYAGLGYAGLGYAGLGHAGLGYAGLGYAGLPLVAAAPAAAAAEE